MIDLKPDFSGGKKKSSVKLGRLGSANRLIAFKKQEKIAESN